MFQGDERAQNIFASCPTHHNEGKTKNDNYDPSEGEKYLPAMFEIIEHRILVFSARGNHMRKTQEHQTGDKKGDGIDSQRQCAAICAD